MLILEIVNKSSLAPVSDYEYKVRLNHRVITEGKVEGHTRANGWVPLVQMIVDAETVDTLTEAYAGHHPMCLTTLGKGEDCPHCKALYKDEP